MEKAMFTVKDKNKWREDHETITVDKKVQLMIIKLPNYVIQDSKRLKCIRSRKNKFSLKNISLSDQSKKL